MATLNLREVERDERGKLVEQGSGHMGTRVLNGHIETRSIPSFAVDIKREILQAVYAADGAVSSLQIAKAVNRKKTRWLLNHINDLVEAGYLVRLHGYGRNGFLMYFYEVAQ